MAKQKRQDELLFHAAGTMPDGTKRHFCVYTHEGAVLITSRMQGRTSRHLCSAHVKTEDQITSVIRLVFRVADVTVVRLR